MTPRRAARVKLGRDTVKPADEARAWRRVAWDDVEDALATLRECGWNVDRAHLIDEPGQPIRAVLRVHRDRDRSVGVL